MLIKKGYIQLTVKFIYKQPFRWNNAFKDDHNYKIFNMKKIKTIRN